MVEREPASDAASALPPELVALIEAGDTAGRDRAWHGFVEQYSRLILHVARSFGREYDAVMDRYSYVLERLRQDEFRRLRQYVADGRGKFTTWLTVVVRRLCLDYQRKRYGRPRGEVGPEGAERPRETRKRLADLVVTELDVTRLRDARGDDPEATVRKRELAAALDAALDDLAPRDRLLLTLRFEDGRSAREIADVMGFSTLFHVYRRLNAVLKQLRDGLAARGIDEAAP